MNLDIAAVVVPVAAIVVSGIVTIYSVRVQARSGRETRQLQRDLDRSNDVEQRRRDRYDRLAVVYTDVHAAGSELLRWLITADALHLPRLVRTVLGLRKIRDDRLFRELGHRRARMELHGAPTRVLRAWRTFDDAIEALTGEQLRRGDVTGTGRRAVEALDQFTQAAAEHLESVWPSHSTSTS